MSKPKTAPKATTNKKPHEYYLKYGTWSAAIRQLAGEGHTTAEIATTLGKRYQHVRNVLTRPMKRGPQGRSKG